MSSKLLKINRKCYGKTVKRNRRYPRKGVKGIGKYAIDDVSSFISQSLDKKYSDVVLRLQRAETYVIFPSSSSSALIGLSLSN